MTDLFLKVLNMSISAGWLILAVILLRLLLKRAPKWVTVALWGLAGIRLAFPFSIESIFSLIPSRETISPEIAVDPAPAVDTGIPALNQAVNPVINDHLAPAPWNSVNPLQIWISVCSVIWIVGMVCLLLYAVVTYLRLRRRVAAAVPLGNDLYQCESVDSPFVLGILRPRIYLPFYVCGTAGQSGAADSVSPADLPEAADIFDRADLSGAADISGRADLSGAAGIIGVSGHSDAVAHFGTADLSGAADFSAAAGFLPLHAVIAHEQAHIRRRDHWWKPLGFLLLAIHWFNPLVWAAYVLLCRDIELACDEKVIRELDKDQRADYSQALLSCSAGQKRITACPLAFGEAGVKVRVKSVLNYRKPAFWVIVTAVIALAAVALCFLTDPAGQRESMAWARGLSADQVVSAVLMVSHQAPESQFMRLSGEEISAMVDLINRSKGRYLEEHEDGDGGSIFFYLTLQDGSTHSVGNIGNTYLFIDGDYYQAKYNWLSTWEETFGEGNEPLPEGFSFGQATSGQTTAGASGNSNFSSGGNGSAAVSPEGDGSADGEAEKSVFQDAAIWEDADLDHDGEKELILVRVHNDGEYYELEVVKQDGTILWSRDMGTAHTGWGAILLYESGGEDYLVEYLPAVYQGMGSYVCTQFSLEGGVETEENRWTADFQMPVLEMTGEMRAFAEVGNRIMKDGILLLSTVEGEAVVGPGDATEATWLYPVSFGEEEDSQDGMGTDLPGGTQTGTLDGTQDNMPDSTQVNTPGGVPINGAASGQGQPVDRILGEHLFRDSPPPEFLFASGAGGWGTTLTCIQADILKESMRTARLWPPRVSQGNAVSL